MSRRIFSDGLLARDLVVTANALEQSRDLLPSDLYFYSWRANKTSIFGARGICLDDHPDLLMDIIMGSSSVFPIFPPRRLENFPVAGERIDLVDGGFAHNSPIEAAVLRGATHIILIESTPAERGEHKNLAANAAAAFEHLHKQSQLVDLRSKRHVVIFTLVPKPPHICTVDFTDTLIDRSIQNGYLDARGKSAADQDHSTLPSFRKELGEPVFTEVNPSSKR
jgi:predicted acylesterase/phospholipase RssA